MLQQKSIQQDENVSVRKDVDFVKETASRRLVSIIIPLFNEEKSIKNVINRIDNRFLTEIIVVDDGSSDNSVKKVQEIKNQNVKIIRHKTNKGYGAAILTGIKHATGDVIITIDSDGQHNPEEIPNLINPILCNQADIVIGSRNLGTSNYRIPLHTRIGEILINRSLSCLFGQKIKNNQSGYRAFSKKTLEIFKNTIFSKFAFCTETLFKAASKNFTIKEIPIELNERKYGVSYVKILEIFKSIGSCIFLYFLKKIKIGTLVPKFLWEKIHFKFLQHLKKLY